MAYLRNVRSFCFWRAASCFQMLGMSALRALRPLPHAAPAVLVCGRRVRRANAPGARTSRRILSMFGPANQLKTFRADGASWAAGDNEVACVRWWQGGVVGRERV